MKIYELKDSGRILGSCVNDIQDKTTVRSYSHVLNILFTEQCEHWRNVSGEWYIGL